MALDPVPLTGKHFLEVLTSSMPLTLLGTEMAECNETRCNARPVANLPTDTQRLLEVSECLISAPYFPLQAGQGMVNA